MAVVCVITRNHATEDVSTSQEFCTATLTGTYVTGGFAVNMLSITGVPGSSPRTGTIVLDVAWRSPTANTYFASTAYTGRAALTTVKIFTAPSVELANGAAMPDATISLVIVKRKI